MFIGSHVEVVALIALIALSLTPSTDVVDGARERWPFSPIGFRLRPTILEGDVIVIHFVMGVTVIAVACRTPDAVGTKDRKFL